MEEIEIKPLGRLPEDYDDYDDYEETDFGVGDQETDIVDDLISGTQ